MPIHPACERTVLAHAYLVTQLAGRIHRRLPSHIDLLTELVAAGHRGLLEAAQRYEWSDENPTFTRFAYLRVKGAMMDELRSQDALPRGLRNKTEISFEDVSEELSESRANPEEELTQSQTRDRVQALLNGLSEVERFVMIRYFEHNFTLLQIAAHLDLSESRVSQIKNRALAQMREALQLAGVSATRDLL